MRRPRSPAPEAASSRQPAAGQSRARSWRRARARTAAALPDWWLKDERPRRPPVPARAVAPAGQQGQIVGLLYRLWCQAMLIGTLLAGWLVASTQRCRSRRWGCSTCRSCCSRRPPPHADPGGRDPTPGLLTALPISTTCVWLRAAAARAG
jgi:hypothetical protein